MFKAWLDRKTKEKRQRLKKENEARWKANKFTGRYVGLVQVRLAPSSRCLIDSSVTRVQGILE